MLCNATGYAMGRGAWCQISREKCYKGIGLRVNVISITRGWVDVTFPGKNPVT